MKLAFKTIDHLLNNPNKFNLIALNKLLTIGIPFNAPHGFKIKTITDELVEITLPNRKLNHNHIGGIHACALATLGEFCAGLSLLRSFKISEYRLIMSELNAKYTYQARKNLLGRCTSQFDSSQIQKDLDTDGVSTQKMETSILDNDGQVVAIITTTWQIKRWSLVKTKPL